MLLLEAHFVVLLLGTGVSAVSHLTGDSVIVFAESNITALHLAVKDVSQGILVLPRQNVKTVSYWFRRYRLVQGLVLSSGRCKQPEQRHSARSSYRFSDRLHRYNKGTMAPVLHYSQAGSGLILTHPFVPQLFSSSECKLTGPESHCIFTVGDPFRKGATSIVAIGVEMRGAIYAGYAFSEQILHTGMSIILATGIQTKSLSLIVSLRSLVYLD